jgi:hypothetical protein
MVQWALMTIGYETDTVLRLGGAKKEFLAYGLKAKESDKSLYAVKKAFSKQLTRLLFLPKLEIFIIIIRNSVREEHLTVKNGGEECKKGK